MRSCGGGTAGHAREVFGGSVIRNQKTATGIQSTMPCREADGRPARCLKGQNARAPGGAVQRIQAPKSVEHEVVEDRAGHHKAILARMDGDLVDARPAEVDLV